MPLPQAPLFFTPCFQKKMWGGHTLYNHFHKLFPPDVPIGESWEISGIENCQPSIAQGTLRHQTLSTIYKQFAGDLVGTQYTDFEKFPLLIKFIDAHEALSVQVHPDDIYAQTTLHEPFGKTECWYIAHTIGSNGRICVGFKRSVTRSELATAIKNGSLEKLLNIISVSVGEVYYIPAGTVHAILGNVVIYEVQQSSDTTFRMYDWQRTDTEGKSRTLHIEEALSVANLSGPTEHKVPPVLKEDTLGYTSFNRMCSRYFTIDEYHWKQGDHIPLPYISTCRILTMLKGNGKILWNRHVAPVQEGTTILIPASLQHCSLYADEGARCLSTSTSKQ